MMTSPGFYSGRALVLSLFGSATSTGSITLPASIPAGALILYGNWGRNFSGGAASAAPGALGPWTTLIDDDLLVNSNSCRASVWAKIAAGTEGGGNPGGSNGGVENLRWALVFVGDSPITSFNVINLQHNQTDSDPADITVTPGDGQLLLAGYRSSGAVTTRDFSPAETGVINPSTLAYVKYKLLPAATLLGMGDDGNSNSLWGFAVQALG